MATKNFVPVAHLVREWVMERDGMISRNGPAFRWLMKRTGIPLDTLRNYCFLRAEPTANVRKRAILLRAIGKDTFDK